VKGGEVFEQSRKALVKVNLKQDTFKSSQKALFSAVRPLSIAILKFIDSARLHNLRRAPLQSGLEHQ